MTVGIGQEQRIADLRAEVERLRDERDQARAIANETAEWLDRALNVLGVATVFDIPPAGKQR